MPNPFDLSGRTALVTGSSRGLGRAMRGGPGRRGGRSWSERRRSHPPRRGRGALRAPATGPRRAFDVTDEAGNHRRLARCDAEGVAIDILVNNAGIQFARADGGSGHRGWRRVIDTNLTSAFVVGREAARRMIPRGQRQDHQYRLADQRARARRPSRPIRSPRAASRC